MEAKQMFSVRKNALVKGLQDKINDKSPKGSVDEPIVELIQLLNNHPNYVTTSSCSGRFSLFQNNIKTEKGGKWLLVKHAALEMEDFKDILEPTDDILFKHEPFVMHVQCRSVDAAQRLLQIALECGFRESGIVLGKTKTMVGVRTTANMLELPLVVAGQLVVSKEYLEILVQIGNEKFLANYTRTQKLFHQLQMELGPEIPSDQLVVVETPSLLLRYGHSSTRVDRFLYVIGGFGQNAQGQVTRLDDVVRVSLDHDPLQAVRVHTTGDQPAPRMNHSTVQNDNCVLVFGGRSSPMKPFNDLYSFDTKSSHWTRLEPTGQCPSPRWSHTAVTVSNRMIVYGGKDEHLIFPDIYILSSLDDLSRLSWTRLDSSTLPTLYSHSCVAFGESSFLVYGGCSTLTGDQISDAVFVYDIEKQDGSIITTKKAPPYGRFSHAAYLYSHRFMIVSGGLSYQRESSAITNVAVLDCANWKWIECDLPALKTEHTCLVRHEMDATEDHVFCIGGGCQCFGFGHTFNPVVSIPVHALHLGIEIPEKRIIESTPSTISVAREQVKTVKTLLEAAGVYDKSRRIVPDEQLENLFRIPILCDEMSLTSSIRQQITAAQVQEEEKVEEKPVEHLSLIVDKINVKLIKSMLEAEGLYDKSRRIRPYPEIEDAFLIPVKNDPASCERLAAKTAGTFESVADNESVASKHYGVNPNTIIRDTIRRVINQHGLDPVLMQSVPDHFERVSDVLMITPDSFREPDWIPIREELWQEVCCSSDISRVARKATIDPSMKRHSRVELIYSAFDLLPKRSREDVGWVDVKENGITYSFDITKVMFSSGNVTEKFRMGKIGCADETIVDMYAGIGYYVLPFLVHGKASFVYALDWNPDSIDALRHNLVQNHVQDRCQVIPGDNRLTAWSLGPIADRVNLGLLPSSEPSWEAAVHLLKDTGGWVHVHGNIPTSSYAKWYDEN